MEIQKIEIFKSKIKLKEAFIISLEKLEYAENVIVKITTNEGLVGFGECSPFKTINGESIETCYEIGQYLAKVLLGKNPIDIELCINLMDKVIYGNASIKSAFDMALYDIASQYAKLPLYLFLNGSKNKTLITDYTISIGDPQKMASDAIEIKEQEYKIIKVKLGENKKNDIERIQFIRQAVGMEIPIRIDANQGWNTTETIETLSELEKYNIQHCEEPIPRWSFMDLPYISLNSNIPIMADESCCNHHDADRLIKINACKLFNVKLGKSGGIYDALKIIKLAEQALIKIQIGGFLESRLGFTASAHLALSSDCITFFDFDTPLMFVEDNIIGGISYSKGGEVNIPDSIGLGAQPDETYLNKLPKIIIS
ncbi:MAG: dipeptide epimerase [Bacteroidota bacterium]|nr:dipeptide epimerase [Bacteroidota bacterium]